MEILENNAFLSASSGLESSSPCTKRKQPLKQMKRAIFILDYIGRNELHLDNADSELAYSLLFAAAISSLINFENRIEGKFVSKEAQILEENVKKAIMVSRLYICMLLSFEFFKNEFAKTVHFIIILSSLILLLDISYGRGGGLGLRTVYHVLCLIH